jgi:hypothetical protein
VPKESARHHPDEAGERGNPTGGAACDLCGMYAVFTCFGVILAEYVDTRGINYILSSAYFMGIRRYP